MRVPPLSSTLAAGSLLAGTLAACAVGEPTGASPVAAGKLAPAVASATRDGQARSFIAQLRRAAGPADLLALRRVGARVTQRYTHLPMVAVTAPGAAAPRLAALPFVTRLSPDLQVRRSLEIAGPAVGANAARRDYGVTGRGVTVAVIDSGIAGSNDLSRSHSDSRSRVVAGYDFVTRTQTLQKNDPCGHGSCVAGIIAGNAYNSSALLSSKQFYGVAPEVNLANLRVLDKNGSGTVANALAAIDWCIRNKAALNIRVINMSLGHAPGESYTTDPLCQASERAWQSGILVVCAAGNRGRKVANDKTSGAAYGTINSPGNDPYVLTVGAVNDFNTQGTGDDEIASFSSRGPSRLDHILKPDLVAPGNR
ncbi:MAG TPA: S8 family serine peptidase, partial [Armatimonadota bacterium]|nr:S8 family serine peptidase [Armatimonadota bacterium]